MNNLGILALAVFVFLAGRAKTSSASAATPGPRPGDVPTQQAPPTTIAQQQAPRPIAPQQAPRPIAPLGGSGLPSAKEVVSVVESVLDTVNKWKSAYYASGGFTDGSDE